MMVFLTPQNPKNPAAPFVLAALKRSVSNQVRKIAPVALDSCRENLAVAVSPDESLGKTLLNWLGRGKRKLVLFGKLPATLQAYLDMKVGVWPDRPDQWAKSQPAPTYRSAQSQGEIHYRSSVERLGLAAFRRPLERFDFTDEWNNLGYGAIRTDGSVWSLAMPLHAPLKNQLAFLDVNGQSAATYVALFDGDDTAVLWVNREAGLIDSFEWRLVEHFLAHYRHDECDCCPVISDIPYGYDSAVTMRLDCDEDIEAASSLKQVYRQMNVPFSLAIHTTHLADSRHHAILRELAAEGGGILSHTATHAPNWGGRYESALQEARDSKAAIERVIDRPVQYVVSPFHQTPAYALDALVDSGYTGCIGGIIRNDPEFLFARGGCVAFQPEGFVGHSQQCMLHGDCMLDTDDPLAVYKQAYDQAHASRTFFGYLDHPFSARYQYGWKDEDSRIKAHQHFIGYIREKAENPVFMNEEQAMAFLLMKSQARLHCTSDGLELTVPYEKPAAIDRFSLAVEYKGSVFDLSRECVS